MLSAVQAGVETAQAQISELQSALATSRAEAEKAKSGKCQSTAALGRRLAAGACLCSSIYEGAWHLCRLHAMSWSYALSIMIPASLLHRPGNKPQVRRSRSEPLQSSMRRRTSCTGNIQRPWMQGSRTSQALWKKHRCKPTIAVSSLAWTIHMEDELPSCVWQLVKMECCRCTGHDKEAGQTGWGGAGYPCDCASTDQWPGAVRSGADRREQAGEDPPWRRSLRCSEPPMRRAIILLPWLEVQAVLCRVQRPVKRVALMSWYSSVKSWRHPKLKLMATSMPFRSSAYRHRHVHIPLHDSNMPEVLKVICARVLRACTARRKLTKLACLWQESQELREKAEQTAIELAQAKDELTAEVRTSPTTQQPAIASHVRCAVITRGCKCSSWRKQQPLTPRSATV